MDVVEVLIKNQANINLAYEVLYSYVPPTRQDGKRPIEKARFHRHSDIVNILKK